MLNTENVKSKIKQKYKSDELYRKQVISASSKRYRTNQNLREKKLIATANRCEKDEIYRSKTKVSSRNQYDSNLRVKVLKKESVKNRRSAKQSELKNEERVVKAFKEKAMQGIDYSCCCCDRLMFQNQIQRCDRHSYAKNDQARNVAE